MFIQVLALLGLDVVLFRTAIKAKRALVFVQQRLHVLGASHPATQHNAFVGRKVRVEFDVMADRAAHVRPVAVVESLCECLFKRMHRRLFVCGLHGTATEQISPASVAYWHVHDVVRRAQWNFPAILPATVRPDNIASRRVIAPV